MSKFTLVQYRNHKDFKFGSWKHEHHNNGGVTIRGRLKKNNCISKYMDIIKCK